MKHILFHLVFLFPCLAAYSQRMPDKVFITSSQIEIGKGEYKRGGSDMYVNMIRNELEIIFNNSSIESATLYSGKRSTMRKRNRKKIKVLFSEDFSKTVALQHPEAAFSLATLLLNKSYQVHYDTIRYTRKGQKVEVIETDTSDRSGMTLENFGISNDSIFYQLLKAFNNSYLIDDDSYDYDPEEVLLFILSESNSEEVARVYSRADSITAFINHLTRIRHNDVTSFDIIKFVSIDVIQGSDTVSFYQSYPERFVLNWRMGLFEKSVTDPQIHNLLSHFLPKDFFKYEHVTKDGSPEYFLSYYTKWISRRKWVKNFVNSQKKRD